MFAIEINDRQIIRHIKGNVWTMMFQEPCHKKTRKQFIALCIIDIGNIDFNDIVLARIYHG
jgi:hypothetical protein